MRFNCKAGISLWNWSGNWSIRVNDALLIIEGDFVGEN